MGKLISDETITHLYLFKYVKTQKMYRHFMQDYGLANTRNKLASAARLMINRSGNIDSVMFMDACLTLNTFLASSSVL